MFYIKALIKVDERDEAPSSQCGNLCQHQLKKLSATSITLKSISQQEL